MPIVYICDGCGKEKQRHGCIDYERWETIRMIGGGPKVLCPDCKKKDLNLLAEKRRKSKIDMAVEMFRNGLEQTITIAEVMEEIKKELLAEEMLIKALNKK